MNRVIIILLFTCFLPSFVIAASCGDTLVADTVLNSSLSCGGDGLELGADNIVLDCNGHSLNGSLSGIGIKAYQFGATIKNCNINRFYVGIRTNGDGNLIEDNDLFANTHGMEINSDDNQVRENHIHSQGSGNEVGMFISWGSDNTVADNNFTGNYRAIWFGGTSHRNNITRNLFQSHNMNFYYNSVGIDNNTIYRNTFYNTGILDNSINNYCYGVGNIYLNNAGLNRGPHDCGPAPSQAIMPVNSSAVQVISFGEQAVFDNIADAVANAHDGAIVVVVAGTNFSRPVFMDNYYNLTLDCSQALMNGTGGGYGITISNSRQSTVKNCDIYSYYIGVWIGTSQHITIRDNAIGEHSTSGIDVTSTAPNNTILNNHIHANLQRGIMLSSSDNEIRNNRISDHDDEYDAGIMFSFSPDNVIADNNFTNNGRSIWLLQSSHDNIITNNTMQAISMNIFYNAFVVNNIIFRNIFIGRGVGDRGGDIYCNGVGNIYRGGAGYDRARGDCGPLPNVDTFSVNPANSAPLVFDEAATGTYATNAPISEVVANTNVFHKQTVLLEKDSGPYREAIRFSYLNQTVLDCNDNLLNGSMVTYWYAITIRDSTDTHVRRCRIERFHRAVYVMGGRDTQLTENTIINNQDGVYYTNFGSFGAGPTENATLHFNNILNNSGYNVMNAQSNNISAWHNWWGAVQYAQILPKIYDHLDYSGSGTVMFQPFLEGPVTYGIFTSQLPPTRIGNFTSHELIAVAGSLPYTWSLMNGSIPPGMTFHTDGILDGTPTQIGNYTFSVMVNDSDGKTDTRIFTKRVVLVLPDLIMRISKEGTTPVPDREIDYFIVVENPGTTTEYDLVVFENLNFYFEFISANPIPTNITSIQINTNITGLDENLTRPIRLEWKIPSLAPGEIKVFHYKVRLVRNIEPGTIVQGGKSCVDKNGDPCKDILYDCLDKGKLACAIICGVNFFSSQISGLDPISWSMPDPCRICEDFYNTICFENWDTCKSTSQTECAEVLDEGTSSSKSCCDDDDDPSSIPRDPNEKLVLSEKYIRPDEMLIYPIHYENVGNISALDVFVTDELDENLDLGALRVFNGSFMPLAQGQILTLYYENKTRTINITIGNTTVQVNITVIENRTVTLNNRTIFFSLKGIELEPNATEEVMYSIEPSAGLSSGTEIRNNATIQFEIFETLTTNDTVNIIDDVPPSCTVDPLPTESSPDFIISWNTEDAVGEIAEIVLFVSTPVSTFTSVNQTTPLNETSAVFHGEPDTNYSFICTASDTAGNGEVQGPGAEAVTRTSLVAGDNDGDGVLDIDDNCPYIYPNPGQEDLDGDFVGDVCDVQTCGNGVAEFVPSGDGFGFTEQCDDNNTDSGDGCSSGCTLEDHDGDFIPDLFDNCPSVFNPTQSDLDWDGLGDACDIETFSLFLTAGWNLISIPLLVENNSVDDVFDGISYSDLFVFDNEYTVPTVVTNSGLWIKVGSEQNLTVQGLEQGSASIDLNQGWNLVGYPSLVGRNTSDVYNSSVYSYNGSWNSYSPWKTGNSLDMIRPGFGFWVFSDENLSLGIS